GWGGGVLGSIVLSAVSAVVVVRLFLGDQPLFAVPEFRLASAAELFVYALLGVVGGVSSAVFVKLVGWVRARMARPPSAMIYAQAFAAGLAVGVAGLWLPEVLGAGYAAIGSALHDRFTWDRLLVLGAVKMAATLVCFSAGTPGGMFAPALFTGAMIGGGVGGLAAHYLPFPTSAPSAYVLVGMGTFFAGVFRAPMTSIFMVFEVSASYVIILPVMIANTISYLISRGLQRMPFFTMIAREDGLDLPTVEDDREAVTLRVEDAMTQAPAVLLPETPVARALEEVARNGPVLVAREEGAWCWVGRAELEAAAAAGNGARALGDAVELAAAPRLYLDLSIDAALRLLGSHPVLPVSSRARPYVLLGVVRLEDVRRAYAIPAPKDRPA
ncbi:MAG: chloride channel protein, partial [Bryobacteraceae bacterium]